MDAADRSEAPHAPRVRTDIRRRDGGDDEGGEADDEDAPSRAAAPGAGRSRAPERHRRDDGDAAVTTKMAKPTARARRPSRPLRGHVNVEPPSAIGETARRRGGEDENGPARTAKPAAAR